MTINPQYHDLRDDPNHTIGITPVRKSNWKTGGAKEYWEPKIGKFRKEQLLTLIVEVVAADSHPQNAAVVRIGKKKVMELAKETGERNIRFKQLSINDQGGDSIFTLFPNVVDVGGINKRNIIVGRSEEAIEEFSEVITDPENSVESYRTAAEYIGMPDCCTDFHEENALNLRADPLYDIAANTDTSHPHEGDHESPVVQFPDPLLNIFWRYQGFYFINHLPCSFDCDESSDIARKTYDILADTCGEQQLAEDLLSWLDLPLTWSGYHSLVNIKNAYGIGSYTTDDYWDKKEIMWYRPHQPKPEFEPNHPTSRFEPIDPSNSQI